MNKISNIIKVPLMVFGAVLYFEDDSPFWFRPLMMFYVLFLLAITQVLSIVKNGTETLSKERWIIIGFCVLAIEIVNQISYLISKNNYSFAKKFKIILFWSIFTIGSLWYSYQLIILPGNLNWSTNRLIFWVAILLISWVTPWYSSCPKIRFLSLYGGLIKKK